MRTAKAIDNIPRIEPIVFDDFFELGQEESASPFLTTESKRWGSYLTIKSALLATLLLFLSFLLSFSTAQLPLSHFLLVIVYFLVGVPALIESLQELMAFEINIDILMTLAAFSSVLIGSGMEGALLLVLFALSGAMEDVVTSKAKNSISSLHKLSPTKAWVITEEGTLIERSLMEIAVGTSILIKAGQIIPLDGVVISGASSVNLVHLTGENLPILKKVGDSVPAGARNLEGALTVRVSHTSADSTLAKIIELVTQAQEEKPILQRWFDRLSKGYAISIITLSAFFALSIPLIFEMPYLTREGSIYRALAFLIAASPCALIIAIPIAYLSAIGSCARQGILLKGGITLDALAQCSILAFDKTGTLTTGNLTFQGIDSLQTRTVKELNEALAIAYALEKNAVHPIAKGIVAYGESQQLPTITLEHFQTVPGFGLKAIALTEQGEQEVFIGRYEYLLETLTNEEKTLLIKAMENPQNQGELVAILKVGQQLFILRFSDTLRPQVKETISKLKEEALELVILTGDHPNNAKRIANEVGIANYRANLTPEAKLQYVSHAANMQGLVMIGDGINDAPALARATVGICMGRVGSTPAIDAADVILLQDNIERLPWLLKKAYATECIVRQNLFLATAAIIVASLPALGGMIPLWLAVILHEGGTVLVGLNGLRLLKI